MSPRPTGRVRSTARGADLVLTRRFRAPIEDVWQSVTKSESTARWYGPWEGDAGSGKTIRVTMAFEEGSPATNMTIDVCEAPRRLVLSSKSDYGEFHLELALRQDGDTTELEFTHRLTDPKQAGDFGPGWEYYFDNLVAARADQPLPKFTDYYPSQREYYLGDALK